MGGTTTHFGSNGTKEMTWAPISNIQQYPFDDIMNPDGIIDLRLLARASPNV